MNFAIWLSLIFRFWRSKQTRSTFNAYDAAGVCLNSIIPSFSLLVSLKQEYSTAAFLQTDWFCWYIDTSQIHISQPKHFLTFRSHHEIFIRRSWYSVLPSLDATISCRIKKTVVGVTQLITALVSRPWRHAKIFQVQYPAPGTGLPVRGRIGTDEYSGRSWTETRNFNWVLVTKSWEPAVCVSFRFCRLRDDGPRLRRFVFDRLSTIVLLRRRRDRLSDKPSPRERWWKKFCG